LALKDPEAVAKKSSQSTAEIPVIASRVRRNCRTPRRSWPALASRSHSCFTISDTSTVWVLVNVYQADLAYVRKGQEVEISTDSYPEKFHGKIPTSLLDFDATTAPCKPASSPESR